MASIHHHLLACNTVGWPYGWTQLGCSSPGISWTHFHRYSQLADWLGKVGTGWPPSHVWLIIAGMEATVPCISSIHQASPGFFTWLPQDRQSPFSQALIKSLLLSCLLMSYWLVCHRAKTRYQEVEIYIPPVHVIFKRRVYI